MFVRKLILARHLFWALLIVAMYLQFAGASPAAAATDVYIVYTATTLSVSNLNLYPSNHCDYIQLAGDFVIQAHIVYPSNTIFPPNPSLPAGTNVTLHLDATHISGIGLTDGMLYQGTQGTSQDFVYPPSTMVFNAAFELIPSQPNPFPPNPCSPAQLTFQVQIYTAEGGIPALSVSILPPTE